jgi:hypothetical protein
MTMRTARHNAILHRRQAARPAAIKVGGSVRIPVIGAGAAIVLFSAGIAPVVALPLTPFR